MFLHSACVVLYAAVLCTTCPAVAGLPSGCIIACGAAFMLITITDGALGTQEFVYSTHCWSSWCWGFCHWQLGHQFCWVPVPSGCTFHLPLLGGGWSDCFFCSHPFSSQLCLSATTHLCRPSHSYSMGCLHIGTTTQQGVFTWAGPLWHCGRFCRPGYHCSLSLHVWPRMPPPPLTVTVASVWVSCLGSIWTLCDLPSHKLRGVLYHSIIKWKKCARDWTRASHESTSKLHKQVIHTPSVTTLAILSLLPQPEFTSMASQVISSDHPFPQFVQWRWPKY